MGEELRKGWEEAVEGVKRRGGKGVGRRGGRQEWEGAVGGRGGRMSRRKELEEEWEDGGGR